MKRIVLVAMLAGVAACSKPAPTPEATAEAPAEAPAEASAAPAAEPLAADGKSSVGKFKVTTSEGKIVMEEAKADGTYVDTIAGKTVETGKWEQKSPSQYCYTKDEAGAKQVCNTEQVDDKGVWTSKSPDGKIGTVERVG